MKKYYSILMMLAMMVAALSFTACGGDDDEDEDDLYYNFVIDEENPNKKASLKIDGEAYYIVAYLSSGYYGGLKLYIEGYKSQLLPDKILELHISGISKVSDIKVGETISSEDLSIEHYENGYVIAMYEKDYEIIGGSITFQSLDRYEVKVKFNDLKFALESSSNIFGEEYEPQNPKIHTVSGTAICTGNAWNDDGIIPFF